MKMSLKIVKAEGDKIMPFLKPLTLTKIDVLRNNLLIVEKFLELTNTTLGKKQITVQTWNTSTYGMYIIPYVRVPILKPKPRYI